MKGSLATKHLWSLQACDVKLNLRHYLRNFFGSLAGTVLLSFCFYLLGSSSDLWLSTRLRFATLMITLFWELTSRHLLLLQGFTLSSHERSNKGGVFWASGGYAIRSEEKQDRKKCSFLSCFFFFYFFSLWLSSLPLDQHEQTSPTVRFTVLDILLCIQLNMYMHRVHRHYSLHGSGQLFDHVVLQYFLCVH